MPIETTITEKNQAHPQNSNFERLFLEGVREESVVQGYSAKAQGRLWVRALRTLEDR